MLTEEQILFFKKNGYVSGIKILNGDQVDLLNQELTQL